jgi:polar amino acid transport system ATP-binding protein
MEEGAILESGTPEEVFGNPQEQRTREFLGQIV